MNTLGEKGIWAAVAVIAAFVANWLRGRRERAAVKRADGAATAAAAAEHESVVSVETARKAQADEALQRERSRVGDMPDAAVDADALARVDRDRAERKGLFSGGKR